MNLFLKKCACWSQLHITYFMYTSLAASYRAILREIEGINEVKEEGKNYRECSSSVLIMQNQKSNWMPKTERTLVQV